MGPVTYTRSRPVYTPPLAGPKPAPNEEIIWKMQLRLRMLNYLQGPVTGYLNAETEAAARAFKKDQGLPGDTVLDDNTLTALGVFDD